MSLGAEHNSSAEPADREAHVGPVTRLFAVRHGETAWNVGQRIQGFLDIPLNVRGQWQAERVAQALAQENLAVVYSSDLSRACVTAEAVAKPHGLSVVREPGLRERCFGHFEGQSFAEIETQWPDQARRWRERDPDFAPDGGESLQQFFARITQTVSTLAARHPGAAIAIVAHGGVMDCLYRAASHLPLQAPRAWELSNAAINRLLYTPQGFHLVGWGDTLHLDGQSEDDTDGTSTALTPNAHPATDAFSR